MVHKSDDKTSSYFGSFFPIFNDNRIKLTISLFFITPHTIISSCRREYNYDVK